MIIVLKPHTSEENIHRVENLVKKHGLDTHLVQGTGNDDHRMYRRYNTDRSKTI